MKHNRKRQEKAIILVWGEVVHDAKVGVIFEH